MCQPLKAFSANQVIILTKIILFLLSLSSAICFVPERFLFPQKPLATDWIGTRTWRGLTKGHIYSLAFRGRSLFMLFQISSPSLFDGTCHTSSDIASVA